MDLDLLIHGLRPLITSFLGSLDYEPPPKTQKEPLRTAMTQRAIQIGVPLGSDDISLMCFETGSSVAADMYPLHDLDIQVHVGMFTWLGFTIDDRNATLGSSLEHFQQLFNTGQRQPSALLESFAEVLRATYKYYDPIAANFIVLSALAFVNSNATEIRHEYQTMIPPKEALNWPYYFRDKEGLPEVYTYFCFPEASYSDITSFLPAVPDMGKFISLTNDILSFYKEEKVGETRNYIYKRALCEGESALSVIKFTVVEAVDSYRRSQYILREKHSYAQVWHTYVMGYVAMHLKNRRYRLLEVGIEDKYLHGRGSLAG